MSLIVFLIHLKSVIISAVSHSSCFLDEFADRHWTAGQRMLRYRKSTANLGVKHREWVESNEASLENNSVASYSVCDITRS